MMNAPQHKPEAFDFYLISTIADIPPRKAGMALQCWN